MIEIKTPSGFLRALKNQGRRIYYREDINKLIQIFLISVLGLVKLHLKVKKWDLRRRFIKKRIIILNCRH